MVAGASTAGQARGVPLRGDDPLRSGWSPLPIAPRPPPLARGRGRVRPARPPRRPLGRRAPSESVDAWPLAIAVPRHSEARRGPHPSPGTWRVAGILHLGGACCSASRALAGPTCSCGGPLPGELSGGNRISSRPLRCFGAGDGRGVGSTGAPVPRHTAIRARPRGAPPGTPRRSRRR